MTKRSMLFLFQNQGHILVALVPHADSDISLKPPQLAESPLSAATSRPRVRQPYQSRLPGLSPRLGASSSAGGGLHSSTQFHLGASGSIELPSPTSPSGHTISLPPTPFSISPGTNIWQAAASPRASSLSPRRHGGIRIMLPSDADAGSVNGRARSVAAMSESGVSVRFKDVFQSTPRPGTASSFRSHRSHRSLSMRSLLRPEALQPKEVTK